MGGWRAPDHKHGVIVRSVPPKRGKLKLPDVHDIQLLLAVITSAPSMCECCSLHTTDRIKFDHTAFLCELLAEIGRKDLTEEVKKYLEKTESELCGVLPRDQLPQNQSVDFVGVDLVGTKQLCSCPLLLWLVSHCTIGCLCLTQIVGTDR